MSILGLFNNIRKKKNKIIKILIIIVKIAAITLVATIITLKVMDYFNEVVYESLFERLIIEEKVKTNVEMRRIVKKIINRAIYKKVSIREYLDMYPLERKEYNNIIRIKNSILEKKEDMISCNRVEVKMSFVVIIGLIGFGLAFYKVFLWE